MRTAAVVGLLALAATAAVPADAGGASRGAFDRTILTVAAARTSPGARTEHELDVTIASSAPATQKVTLYAPAGYSASLAAPVGTRIGNALLRLRSAGASAAGGAALIADEPAKYTTNACAPGLHAAVWIADPKVGGRPSPVTIYVDPAPAELATRAAFELQTCFDAPGAGSRQLQALGLDVLRAFTNPPTRGSYVWRALVTPFDVTGVANPAATVEAEGLLPLPYRLSVETRYDRRRHRVVFSGTATAGTGADARGPVRILVVTRHGFRAFGVTATNVHGRFTFAKTLRTTTRFALVAGNAFFPSCDAPLTSAPCASETLSPSETRVVAVRVPSG